MAAQRRAVVSIGTNSTRFLIVEDGANEGVRHVEHGSIGTRLGEGLREHGALGAAAMQRTSDAIAAFMERVQVHGASVVCIATSAMRRASNGEQFAAEVARLTGAPLAVLDGKDEAACSFAGATFGNGPSMQRRIAVLDIGGGSTECAVGRGGTLEDSLSLEIGAVRLAERYPQTMGGATPDVARAAAQRAREEVRRTVAPFARFRTIDELRAVGGTPITIGAIVLQSNVEHVSGRVLSRASIERVLERLLESTLDERRALSGMIPQRADVLAAGGLILSESLAAMGQDTVRLEANDLLLGYLLRTG